MPALAFRVQVRARQEISHVEAAGTRVNRLGRKCALTLRDVAEKLSGQRRAADLAFSRREWLAL